MKIHELKRIINSIPVARDGEEISMYHPFYRRCFKIEAIDDMDVIDPELPKQLALITASAPHGQ